MNMQWGVRQVPQSSTVCKCDEAHKHAALSWVLVTLFQSVADGAHVQPEYKEPPSAGATSGLRSLEGGHGRSRNAGIRQTLPVYLAAPHTHLKAAMAEAAMPAPDGPSLPC